MSIFCIAFVVRLFFLIFLVPSTPAEFETPYLKAALADMHEPGIRSDFHSTGLPIILRGLFSLIGESTIGARMLICFFGSLTCCSIYLITKKITNNLIGMTAAFLLALYPDHVYLSMHILPDVPWGFLMTVSIGCALLYQRHYELKYGIPFGILLALCAYFKPYALLYPVCYGVLYFALYMRNSVSNCLKLLFIPLITMAVLVIPGGITNDIFPGLPIFSNIFVTWLFAISSLVVLSLSLPGVFVSLRVKLFMPLHGLIILFMINTLFFYGDARCFMTMSPFFMPYAGATVIIITGKIFKAFKIYSLSSDNEWRYLY